MAQVEISSSIATEMLDYTLKRRSVRNNCLWKARRGSEVPAEVIWYFIIVRFPLITSRNNCVRYRDKRAGGERTQALQLTSTVHSRSISKPTESETERHHTHSSHYPQSRAISRTKGIHFHRCGKKMAVKHGEHTPAVLTGKP